MSITMKKTTEEDISNTIEGENKENEGNAKEKMSNEDEIEKYDVKMPNKDKSQQNDGIMPNKDEAKQYELYRKNDKSDTEVMSNEDKSEETGIDGNSTEDENDEYDSDINKSEEDEDVGKGRRKNVVRKLVCVAQFHWRKIKLTLIISLCLLLQNLETI